MATIRGDRQQLVDYFKDFQSKKNICDVVFKVGEEKQSVYGIKAILAARSSAFARQYCSTLKPFENTKSKKHKGEKPDKLKRTVISLPEFNFDEMCALMEYIHSGVCYIGPKILLGLFVASDDFKMDRLKEKCLSILEDDLSESNALYFWKDLSRFKSKRCTEVVVETLSRFISLNAEKILLGATVVILTQAELLDVFSLDGLNLPELGKFHAALIWTKAHMQNKNIGETLHSVFTPFLDYIKLTRIPIQNLVEDVRRSKVVSERLLAHACAHNEMKETFRCSTTLKDDNFVLPLKNGDASAKQQPPLVVGITSNGRRSSFVATNDYDASSLERTNGSGRRVKKQAKNKYDVSQVAYYNNRPSSSSRLTKAKKLSASTPCLDLMF